MVDVVANHFGYAGTASNINYGLMNPFNNKNYFHSTCFIDTSTDQNNVEKVCQFLYSFIPFRMS